MRTRQIQITRLTVALFALASCLFLLASRAEASPPFNGRIAFESERDGNKEIYTMNPDGTGQVNVSNNPAVDVNPSWSPDGTKIAFDSTRDGNAEIYVMNANGAFQTRLTNNTVSDQAPSFSPDGTKILFQRHVNGIAQILLMNATGSIPILLTSTGPNF